jgi:hypothetical protein
MKLFVVFLTAAALATLPLGNSLFAQEYDDYKKGSSEEMVVDALVVRPLGIAGTIVGGAIFLISLPFSAAGGNTSEAYEKLVEAPASYTFKRPLGSFEEPLY